MRKNPLVSIIINNYNYEHFLKRAIDSALNQSYSNIEVIVVDDGSNDNSKEIISNYGNKIISIFQENAGQASTFNTGFFASKGEIICFLDADDFFCEEKISEVVKNFNFYPDIGWCFHTIQLLDTRTGSFLGKCGENESKICDFRLSALRGKILFYAPPTSGLCFKKSFLDKILPMPEMKENRIGADRYLVCASLFSSIGFYLDLPIAIQAIHGCNNYTFNSNMNKKAGLSKIATAYALRNKFPELNRFTNREFAYGISKIVNFKETGKNLMIKLQSEQLIHDYWSFTSLLEKIEITFWVAYRILRKKDSSLTVR